jgi:hypothetical protein
MVGGDGADGAGRQSLHHRVAMLAGTQRRLHFVTAVVSRHVAVGERNVVRRGFAGQRQALLPRDVHHGYGIARGDVRHVVAPPLRTIRFAYQNFFRVW